MKKRVCIVTGAARGIGLATSRLFHTQGYEVVMVDRDFMELEKNSKSMEHTYTLDCDVSIPEQVSELFDKVQKKYGRLNSLVNNAGVAEFGPIENVSYSDWRRVMATNLDGVFLCSQAAIPMLKKSKGSIVNIASISGLRASTLRVSYGTSKAAVIQLSKQQAVELGEYSIRVNCVAPGPVKTKLAMAVHTEEIINAYHDAIPLNRYGSEEEIGNLIYFLCSDKASYITGQLVAADGGFDSAGVGLPALRC